MSVPLATSRPPNQSTTIDEPKARKPISGNIVAPSRDRSMAFLNMNASLSRKRFAS